VRARGCRLKLECTAAASLQFLLHIGVDPALARLAVDQAEFVMGKADRSARPGSSAMTSAQAHPADSSPPDSATRSAGPSAFPSRLIIATPSWRVIGAQLAAPRSALK
jgi:hypothetical protein